MLVVHNTRKSSSFGGGGGVGNSSRHLLRGQEYNIIISAFKNLVQQNSPVFVQLLKAMSPYRNMHEDIFNLAEDKQTELILLPFRTIILIYIHESAPSHSITSMKESLKVLLVCGSDLLQSLGTPGAWIPEQVRTICRDYGLVCIRREGQDVEEIISDDESLNENKAKLKVVDELVPNQISSTRIRECINKGLPSKF